jgi:hypothetical protein
MPSNSMEKKLRQLSEIILLRKKRISPKTDEKKRRGRYNNSLTSLKWSQYLSAVVDWKICSCFTLHISPLRLMRTEFASSPTSNCLPDSLSCAGVGRRTLCDYLSSVPLPILNIFHNLLKILTMWLGFFE